MGRISAHLLSSLCPNRLHPADHIDISGIRRPTVTLASGTQFLNYARDSDNDTRSRLPFPPDTRGFLYYYTPPKAPPLAGEIRFRRANNLDSFHDGKDLLSADKIPWSISLFSLANQSTHVSLREQVLTDKLVSPTMLAKWAEDKLPSLRYPVGRDCTVLYYLRQPFFVRFNNHYFAFYTVTREDIGLCVVLNPFTDRRLKRNHHYSITYSGELWFHNLQYASHYIQLFCPRKRSGSIRTSWRYAGLARCQNYRTGARYAQRL